MNRPTWRQKVIALQPGAEVYRDRENPKRFRIYWPAVSGKAQPREAFTSRRAAWKNAYTVAVGNLWQGALDL